MASTSGNQESLRASPGALVRQIQSSRTRSRSSSELEKDIVYGSGAYRSVRNPTSATELSALDQAEGVAALVELAQFAKRCIARLPSAVGRAVDALERGDRPSGQFARRYPTLHRSLLVVSDDNSPASLLMVMQALERLPEIVVYRLELWRELKRALRIQQDESLDSLRGAVRIGREKGQPPLRTALRTRQRPGQQRPQMSLEQWSG